MKRVIFSSIFFILVSCGTQKATVAEMASAKEIILYETTWDYVNKNPMKLNAKAVIKDEGNRYITVKKIIDSAGLKIKKAMSAWAVKYNGANYFNLGYSKDVNHWKSFAKFDIEGKKLCAIIVDKQSPYLLKSTGTYYGGGLTGALIAESGKWGKNWKDSNGNKKKIILIDLKEIKMKFGSRNSGSVGNYLTRKQLKELIRKNNIKINTDKIKNIKFEKIVEIIKTINNR